MPSWMTLSDFLSYLIHCLIPFHSCFNTKDISKNYVHVSRLKLRIMLIFQALKISKKTLWISTTSRFPPTVYPTHVSNKHRPQGSRTVSTGLRLWGIWSCERQDWSAKGKKTAVNSWKLTYIPILVSESRTSSSKVPAAWGYVSSLEGIFWWYLPLKSAILSFIIQDMVLMGCQKRRVKFAHSKAKKRSWRNVRLLANKYLYPAYHNDLICDSCIKKHLFVAMNLFLWSKRSDRCQKKMIAHTWYMDFGPNSCRNMW